MENLITRKHLMSILAVSEWTILRYEKQGLPSIRIGLGKKNHRLVRYDLEAVQKWIEENA